MKYLKMMSLLILAITMVNCSSDDPPAPAVVDFTADVNGTEVTFSSTMSNVETFEWVFGDGNKNTTDKNPVHAYETPGNYKVILNAMGKDGKPVAIAHDVEVLETVEYLLSGGAAKTEGKIWKMKYEVVEPYVEGIGLVDNALGIMLPIDEDGFLDYISLPQGYNDTFTFVYDGTYKVDNSADNGGSLMSLLYASLNYTISPPPGGDLLGISSELELAPFADIIYTPVDDATWEVSEADFSIDAAIVDPATGEISSTYKADFTGHTSLNLGDYFGYKEYVQGDKVKVIIKEINETEMTVVLAIHTAVGDPSRATYLTHLTFVAVN